MSILQTLRVIILGQSQESDRNKYTSFQFYCAIIHHKKTKLTSIPQFQNTDHSGAKWTCLIFKPSFNSIHLF